MLLLVVGVAFLADQLFLTHWIQTLARRDAERLEVLRGTLRTIQNIVSTGRRDLQLLRSDAEGHVPPESLALFDEAIQETAIRLSELQELEAFVLPRMMAATGASGAATAASHSMTMTRLVVGSGMVVALAVGMAVYSRRSPAMVTVTANAGSDGTSAGNFTAPAQGSADDPVSADGSTTATAVDNTPPVSLATELMVASQPGGARVTVDGIGWGVTPVTIRHLPTGVKRVRVSKDGYATTERIVSVIESRRQTTSIRLRREPEDQEKAGPPDGR